MERCCQNVEETNLEIYTQTNYQSTVKEELRHFQTYVLKFMTYKFFLRKILVIMLQRKNEVNQERERYKVKEPKDIAKVRGNGNYQGDEKGKFRK